MLAYWKARRIANKRDREMNESWTLTCWASCKRNGWTPKPRLRLRYTQVWLKRCGFVWLYNGKIPCRIKSRRPDVNFASIQVIGKRGVETIPFVHNSLIRRVES